MSYIGKTPVHAACDFSDFGACCRFVLQQVFMCLATERSHVQVIGGSPALKASVTGGSVRYRVRDLRLRRWMWFSMFRCLRARVVRVRVVKLTKDHSWIYLGDLNLLGRFGFDDYLMLHNLVLMSWYHSGSGCCSLAGWNFLKYQRFALHVGGLCVCV